MTAFPRKKVIIVGGGFGGLNAVRKLGRSSENLEILLLDKRNHFLFQPLLYQVATAGLGPSDIGTPIRQIVSEYANTQVLLDRVHSVNLQERKVMTETGRTHTYDYLILACGSQYNYFGHEEWEDLAPGLKSIEQALEIRRRVLLAFERAEMTTDSDEQDRLLNFAIIGGGPTGVEMAGALAELAGSTVTKEFRQVNPEKIHIYLVQSGDRILNSFEPELSQASQKALEKRGVTVLTETRASNVTDRGVQVGDRFIECSCVIWAAGVKPARLSRHLGLPGGKSGVHVLPDLSLPGHPEAFAIGDMAELPPPHGPLPGLAPVAIQQGRHVADTILRTLKGQDRRPFRYRDKGQMAVIGRNFGVMQSKVLGSHSGVFAWLAWIFVHLMYLVNHRSRLIVLIQWAWQYFHFRQGARLITMLKWRSHEC